MHTELCDTFGIEYPIFAFTHCRDVVAAVTKAGGLGVLGAVGFSPEQLEVELDWIDAHVDGKPYGVDIIMPAKVQPSASSGDGKDLVAELQSMIPQTHRDFVAGLAERFELPPLPDDARRPVGVTGWLDDVARTHVKVSLAHPIALLVNALGSPPPEIVAQAHEHGVKVAALAGKAQHAEHHVRNGVDIVVAQGTEAGGHTGDIATMVLVPEVVDAVGDRVPVLAAGGIARGRQIAAGLALGAQGVWTGSVWLTTAESNTQPEVIEGYLHATSSDTVRSRSFTGKPARMLRTPWTEAWEADDSPGTLPMPLQNMLVANATTRFNRAHKAHVQFAPVGQVVGQLDRVRPVRDVMFDMVEEYLETIERLDRGVAAARGD